LVHVLHKCRLNCHKVKVRIRVKEKKYIIGHKLFNQSPQIHQTDAIFDLGLMPLRGDWHWKLLRQNFRIFIQLNCNLWLDVWVVEIRHSLNACSNRFYLSTHLLYVLGDIVSLEFFVDLWDIIINKLVIVTPWDTTGYFW
jgi:hypothetical protein